MESAKMLKNARDILLRLHKALIDMERETYEGIHGKVTPSDYLKLLMEDEDFAWLRNFSTLIVEIDELFASKDGVEAEAVDSHLSAIRRLIDLEDPDEYFRAKYQFALQKSPLAAGLQSELRQSLK